MDYSTISLENIVNNTGAKIIGLLKIFVNDFITDFNKDLGEIDSPTDSKINLKIKKIISIIDSCAIFQIKAVIMEIWKSKIELMKDFCVNEYILDYLICEIQNIKDKNNAEDINNDNILSIYL